MTAPAKPHLSVFYAPNNPEVFTTSLPFFEDLRKIYGEESAVKVFLRDGGKYNTTDDTAWIAMSYAIRALDISSEQMELFEWFNNEWERRRFNEEGDLLDPLITDSNFRMKLLFQDWDFMELLQMKKET